MYKFEVTLEDYVKCISAHELFQFFLEIPKRYNVGSKEHKEALEIVTSALRDRLDDHIPNIEEYHPTEVALIAFYYHSEVVPKGKRPGIGRQIA